MKKKVLVCDDHPAILEVTEEILTEEGFEVTTLLSCADIINDTIKFKPDVLLIDMRMKDITGLEAMELLRKDERTKDIPVIIFSANHDIENKVLQAGANGFVGKPFEINKLIEQLTTTISQF